MRYLELSFRQAADMLSDKTYLTQEDAESQLKLMYHVMRFSQQIGRAPDRNEIDKMTEYARNDKALAYHSLTFPSTMVNQLIRNTLKVSPTDDPFAKTQ